MTATRTNNTTNTEIAIIMEGTSSDDSPTSAGFSVLCTVVVYFVEDKTVVPAK